MSAESEEITIEHVPDPNLEAAKKSEGDSKTIVIAATTAAKQDEESFESIKQRLADKETEAANEKGLRLIAQTERDEANSKINSAMERVTKSEAEKYSAQAASFENKVVAAESDVELIEKTLEEAMDAGKSNREIIDLNKKLAIATHAVETAKGVKKNFDAWLENQKKAPQRQTETAQVGRVSSAAQKWIDQNPRFNTDLRFNRVALGAHSQAQEKGIKLDSPEYFSYIESALTEDGLMEDSSDGNGKVTPLRKKVPPSSLGAPVNNDSVAASAGGSKTPKSFRLTPEMREMALRTYGPGTSHNLKQGEAEQRYAKMQMQIAERRARGEKI